MSDNINTSKVEIKTDNSGFTTTVVDCGSSNSGNVSFSLFSLSIQTLSILSMQSLPSLNFNVTFSSLSLTLLISHCRIEKTSLD